MLDEEALGLIAGTHIYAACALSRERKQRAFGASVVGGIPVQKFAGAYAVLLQECRKLLLR